MSLRTIFLGAPKAQASGADLEAAHIGERKDIEPIYLHILESYPVQWAFWRVSRDLLQNFFDHNLTLDGVAISSKADSGMFSRTCTIRIEGQGEYDFKKLLHIGGGDKSGRSDTAGMFGEGTKICALLLLREFGASKVLFASRDWQLEFRLDTVPPELYDEPVRGLFARIEHVPYRAGNFLELSGMKKELGQEIANAKELFFHSNNPDFRNPTVVSKLSKGGLIGFEFHAGKNGHCYDAGQRRHVGNESRWNNLAHLTLWSRGIRVFSSDRERRPVSPDEVVSKLISPLVKSMDVEQLRATILTMERVWPDGALHIWQDDQKVTFALLKSSVLAAKPGTIEFAPKYLADELLLSSRAGDFLKARGYVICHKFFSHLGMPKARATLAQILDTACVSPNPTQLSQLEILAHAMIKLCELGQRKVPAASVSLNIDNVRVYDAQTKQFTEVAPEYLWFSGDYFRAGFATAVLEFISTAIESNHRGRNERAFYSTVETLLEVLLTRHDVFARFRDEWDSLRGVKAANVSGSRRLEQPLQALPFM